MCVLGSALTARWGACATAVRPRAHKSRAHDAGRRGRRQERSTPRHRSIDGEDLPRVDPARLERATACSGATRGQRGLAAAGVTPSESGFSPPASASQGQPALAHWLLGTLLRAAFARLLIEVLEALADLGHDPPIGRVAPSLIEIEAPGGAARQAFTWGQRPGPGSSSCSLCRRRAHPRSRSPNNKPRPRASCRRCGSRRRSVG
jgi:predicted outer membrane lipoprotein